MPYPSYTPYITMSSVIIAGSQESKQLQVPSSASFQGARQLTISFLQDDIQTELVLRGMSDAEDSTMAEYVAVMLSESHRGASENCMQELSIPRRSQPENCR